MDMPIQVDLNEALNVTVIAQQTVGHAEHCERGAKQAGRSESKEQEGVVG